MLGKIGSMFESAKSSLSSFSFGKKSPEASVAAEVLPLKIETPRVETHSKVGETMSDDVALDNWANGGGWKSKIDNDFAATMDGVNGPDLSAFQRGNSKRETGESLAAEIAQVDATAKLSKDFNRTMGSVYRSDLAVFQKNFVAGGETPGSDGLDFMENGRALRSIKDSPRGRVGISLQTAEPERVKAVDNVVSLAPYFDFDRARSSVPSFENIEQPAKRWVPGVAESTSGDPRAELKAVRNNLREFEPRTRTEAPIRSSRLAFNRRILTAAAVMMATIGGVSQAASFAHSHNRKAERSYSVDDVIPMTNEDAARAEALRVAGTNAGQFEQVAQN